MPTIGMILPGLKAAMKLAKMRLKNTVNKGRNGGLYGENDDYYLTERERCGQSDLDSNTGGEDKIDQENKYGYQVKVDDVAPPDEWHPRWK